MSIIGNLFGNTTENKKRVANILSKDKTAYEEFEKIYQNFEERAKSQSDNLFDINSRDARPYLAETESDTQETVEHPELSREEIVERIVDELLITTNGTNNRLPENTAQPVTAEQIAQLPKSERPQLTGSLMKVDITTPSGATLMKMYLDSLNTKFSSRRRMNAYHMFRQGLDILDLDEETYNIIGTNKNSIGHWFPALEFAASTQNFFKVPKTKIVKVPITLLQLTRCNYFELTQSTLDIVNRWAYEAFQLDENKTYFIKTGTYSSKFDFRNAKVTTPHEVREIGSYLLFIHFQALQMASPLAKPIIYGVSTTNEWCVREYIEDKEGNKCIYHGLPLHTEYRVFIDCDEQDVMAVVPYWEPATMHKRFNEEKDAGDPDKIHDAVIFDAMEETLMQRYETNKEVVAKKVREMLPSLKLSGQWSLDIMQNGDDFWLIDMATACSSAFHEVLGARLKNVNEIAIPLLSESTQKEKE